jgi:hypothetical protein
MKSHVDAFLLRHQIDLGRCLAVLFFTAAFAAFYGFLFGTIFFGMLIFERWGWMFMGLAALKGFFAVLEFLLARALWRHQEFARRIVLWLLGAVLAFLAVFAVVSPFFGSYHVNMSGVKFDAIAWHQKILVPLLLLPPVLWTWLAVQTPTVRKEFQNA